MGNPMTDVQIRLATDADRAPITELYNHFVVETSVTFDDRAWTVEERAPWFERFAPEGRYRLLVAEEGGRLLGYAGTLPFRAKAAYETSVETTIYLAEAGQGRGLGRRLYERLFEEMAGEDVHRLLAGVTLPNDASLALHEKLGFTSVGTFREVGRKFGQYWDVAWYERENGPAPGR